MVFLNNKKYLIPAAELVLVLNKEICNEYYKACPKFIQDRVQKYSLVEMNAQIKGFFSQQNQLFNLMMGKWEHSQKSLPIT